MDQNQSAKVILAVDDDPIILMNTAALLEDMGHEVIEAGSGEEALKALKERADIDIMITDQAMPGMTGSELIRSAREARPDLPVILATGYDEGSQGVGTGIRRLGKPYSAAELEDAVAAAA